MNVIWKRPDGFHGASPADFKVVEVAQTSRIWLHKRDQVNFPFRVSGGWQDEEATQRLNRMINLLDQSPKEWKSFLTEVMKDSEYDDLSSVCDYLKGWVNDFQQVAKGDTWEVEIMVQVLGEICRKLDTVL